MKLFLSFLFSIISSVVLSQTYESILATGDWFKFQVTDTGVHKITPDFLSSMGLNNVNPNDVKIYGFGGKSLDLILSDDTKYEVPQIPIYVHGGDDNSFSGSDYILFYAESAVDNYVLENDSFINPYSTQVYYYLTVSGSDVPLRIDDFNVDEGEPDVSISNYHLNSFYEQDLYNLGFQGRRWFGDKFDSSSSSREYVFNFNDIKNDVSETLEIDIALGSVFTSSPNLNVQVYSGGVLQHESALGLGSYNNSLNAFAFTTNTISLTQDNIIDNQIRVVLSFATGADISAEVYLDYISINSVNELSWDESQLLFYNNDVPVDGSVVQYQFSNSQNLNQVWDVTDVFNVSKIENDLGADFNFSFVSDEFKSFVAFNDSNVLSPTLTNNSVVVNQDLKGGVFLDSSGNFEDVDYLIITSSEFISAAAELASFREANDGYNVKVVDLSSIYKEFSSGRQDVAAIRNFVKYIYDNASSEENRLKYLCVIGDGSYDYKDRISDNTNHVPLYHALSSASLINSFSTDDFYTLLDDGEGGFSTSDDMDIAVGRILCRDLSEANTMVQKIIKHSSKSAYGDWRNSMLFISDDVDVSSDAELQEKIVEISSDLEQNVPRANVKKILMDSFDQETTSAGERYPQVKSLVEDYFNQGVSYINYFGHGNEDGVTNEYIFNAETAQSLTNEHFPVFVTLTCQLTKFDNPARVTAGEYLYWNPIGGAVGLITTTRLLYISTGNSLNNFFSDEMFDENNHIRSIGEITRLAKNSLSSSNARTVFCIGDPALKPSLPNPQVELTHVNGMTLSDWELQDEPIKALDNLQLTGRVLDPYTLSHLANYNGEATVTIFDKDLDKTTLANDGTEDGDGNVIMIDFTESGNSVFKGKATIENGVFDINMVLPKNIRIDEGEGKISFYVFEENELDDKSGASAITIGGINEEAEDDNTPPVINLYMNDEYFYSGQLVGSSPSIYAKLYDENGINTAGGVGHDIVAILDGDEVNPIVLNEYYAAVLDDYTNGELTYKLSGLSEGEHTLELRASDTYNNSSSVEITFLVDTPDDFNVTNVLNYPNPFVSYTEFWFSHTSIPNDVLEVTVQVMTVTGKIITTKFATLTGSSSYQGNIQWDGRDDFGKKIGKGVYVYKISVKSTLTNEISSKYEKLVLL